MGGEEKKISKKKKYRLYTYVIVVSVMLGVLEYRMVIGVRAGRLVFGRGQRRQRAQGDHSDL